MQALENIFHTPSNFNVTSLINKLTINGAEDRYRLIPYLVEKIKKSLESDEPDEPDEQIIHVGDRRGNLLCRLKEELL